MRKDIILARYGFFFEEFTKENSFYYDVAPIKIYQHFNKWWKDQKEFPCTYITFRILFEEYSQKEITIENPVLYSKYLLEKTNNF